MLHIFGIHLVICGQCLAARLLVVSCEADFLFILVNGKEKKNRKLVRLDDFLVLLA
jgi:hypothetical protein